MHKISISLIAFNGATQEVYDHGNEVIVSKLKEYQVKIVNKNPDAIFVLTGGSELQAIELLNNKSPVIILAITSDNSYAAAAELKAYCDQEHIPSLLVNFELNELKSKIENFFQFKKALVKFRNYRLGLIGKSSEWLIASKVSPTELKQKFGINIIPFSWEELPIYTTVAIDKEFMQHFGERHTGKLKDSSKVYSLLKQIINHNQLDAITVECFPLVRNNKVTACLALSKLNDDGIPAGCEGDISSITGMIISQLLTGQIPWMANLILVQDSKVILTHCTIPISYVSTYSLTTHFETNEGLAINGKFSTKSVTLFRFNNTFTKAFISEGKTISIPAIKEACRTQLEIELPSENAVILKNNPLGNHHLILPGNHADKLKFLCQMMGVIFN